MRRILVTDDNSDAADSLATLLRRWGHDVAVAYDGVSALQIARLFRPDLALLDIEMPRMHGGELAQALHRLPECALTVIATTGTAVDDPRLGAYFGEFDGYLRKPYDLDELREAIAGMRSLRDL